MEVIGLVPGTDLRPADDLTSALGNEYTALDVSSVAAIMFYYGPHLPPFSGQNIFTPIVWVLINDSTKTR